MMDVASRSSADAITFVHPSARLEPYVERYLFGMVLIVNVPSIEEWKVIDHLSFSASTLLLPLSLSSKPAFSS